MKAKVIFIEEGTRLHKAAYILLSTVGENPAQQEILDACPGIKGEVFMALLDGTNVMSSDPLHWGNEPLEAAHEWATANFESIKDGDLIDATPLSEALRARKEAEKAAARKAAAAAKLAQMEADEGK